MKAAELFIKCLENEGVEYIFGIPGEETLALMDALLDSPIQFVTTRHEQGAAFMADVYGRVTWRAGVCMSTLGPGATNLITGVADANMDHAPLVAIALVRVPFQKATSSAALIRRSGWSKVSRTAAPALARLRSMAAWIGSSSAAGQVDGSLASASAPASNASVCTELSRRERAPLERRAQPDRSTVSAAGQARDAACSIA